MKIGNYLFVLIILLGKIPYINNQASHIEKYIFSKVSVWVPIQYTVLVILKYDFVCNISCDLQSKSNFRSISIETRESVKIE